MHDIERRVRRFSDGPAAKLIKATPGEHGEVRQVLRRSTKRKSCVYSGTWVMWLEHLSSYNLVEDL